MKIYKIVNDENDFVYYGSTKQKLSQRMAVHRSSFKRYEDQKSKMYCSSYEVLKSHNPQIILVEETDCENKEQLRARERHYIETCECVNRNIPGRKQPESYKNWCLKKPEKRAESQENFHKRNPDYHRKYREKKKKMIIDSQINNN